jgi:hypothetical protein
MEALAIYTTYRLIITITFVKYEILNTSYCDLQRTVIS